MRPWPDRDTTVDPGVAVVAPGMRQHRWRASAFAPEHGGGQRERDGGGDNVTRLAMATAEAVRQ